MSENDVDPENPRPEASSVFPLWDTLAVVVAVLGAFDVCRSYLRDLEGPQADVAAQLDDKVVAVTRRSPPEVLELVVSHPELVLVVLPSHLESHVNF